MQKIKAAAARAGCAVFNAYSKNPPVFSAIVAIVLEFYIESFSRHSLLEGIEYLFKSPLAFICNALIIFATMAISFPLKRGIAAWTTAFTVWFAFGTANAIVLMNRPSPFTGSDFLILPSVLEIFTVYLDIWQIALICVGILAAVAGLVVLWVKAPKRTINVKKDCIVLGSTALATALSIHLSIIGGVITTDYGNLLDAYFYSGFPYSFSRSVFCHGISEPNDYDAGDVYALLDDIEANASVSGEIFDGRENPDVIFVQLESFFDISAVKDVALSENPIPFFTELKANYPSGYLHIPLIGSGTANTEFEILTGMNIDYFSPGEYPFIVKLDDPEYACQSMATVFKELGYSTHAMHNNTGTFYTRHEVYPCLGFDRFIPIEYMYDVVYNPLDWAKDTVLIGEIQKCLDSSAGSDFVFTVAVQPHGAYPTEQTGRYDITVSGIPEDEDEKYHMYSYYVNQIKETDEFVRQLVEYYSSVDKDTVIVFYGDHLPDLKLEETDIDNGDLYATEYVIWSNYGLGQGTEAPEMLEAYQLSTYLCSLLNIDGGIMNGVHRLYATNDGEMYDEAHYDAAMQLIEYDALYGEKHCYRDTFPPSATNMVFGATPRRITGISVKNNILTVNGEGFNKYSVVYVDGKRMDTVFRDGNTLLVRKVSEYQTIEIFQEANDGTVLGTGVSKTK